MANPQNYLNKKSLVLTLFSLLLTGGFLAPAASAQQSFPLVQKADLEYLGAFRLPRGENGTKEGFSYGGGPIAFDEADGHLFVGNRDSWIGKVRIPELVKSSNIESLNFAAMVQNLRDPLEGGRSVLEGSAIRGFVVNGNRLYGTAYIYYDAANTARVSHFSRSTDLTTQSATPLKALWVPEKSGYVAGWLTNIPTEWQALLGGSILSGNCCVPIVSRTSFGPSAFAWYPSDFNKDLIPATPLLYYTEEHAALGPWGGSNEIYGGTSMVGGIVIPNGSRSLLYFGTNGTGPFCYGTGGANGECMDPLSSDKGQHAYPYNHQVWAYDLNELAAVKVGSKKPWEVKPYATWSITDFPVISVYGISGVAYDPAKNIIYVSQLQADTDGYSSRALIHAFKVNVDTKIETPTEKPLMIKYNNENDSEPDRGEETEIGRESQSDTHLDNRDAPRSWIRAYRRTIGYVGYLYRTLLSYLTA